MITLLICAGVAVLVCACLLIDEGNTRIENAEEWPKPNLRLVDQLYDQERAS